MYKYVDVLLYAVFTAISFTFLDKLDDFINPLVSLLFMSVLASICFAGINVKKLKSMVLACVTNKLLYLYMTVAIMINWLCSMFAPNDADPFIYLAMTAIVRAICGLLLNIKNNDRLEFYFKLFCVFILLCCIMILHHDYIIGINRNLNFGVVLGFLGGVSGYYYVVYSNKFAIKNNFSPTQILAVRFWPLVIILFCIINLKRISMHTSINNLEIILLVKVNTIFKGLAYHEVGILLLMGVLTLIVPTLFLQRGVSKLGAQNFAIFSAITPIMTDVVYSVSSHSIHLSNICISILISIVLVFIQLKSTLIKFWGNIR